MVKECKVLMWNECVMVIDFNGKEIQMPSTKKKTDTVYVKYDNKNYKTLSKDEYDKYLRRFYKADNYEEKEISE